MNKNHCQWLDIHRYRKNLCLRIRDARCGAGKSPLCGSPGTDCETAEEALVREIREELDTEISVGKLIDRIEYDYPTFHLSMDCFWCEIQSGDLVLKEAEDAKWLTKETLDSVDWLPADITLIEQIRGELARQAANSRMGR